MSDLTSFGIGAAKTATGIATSLYVNDRNNQAAREMAREDRAENYRYNELSAQAAYERQIALTEQYMTPEAQLRHLKNAGLSPSLMYGRGGETGSATVNAGNGANGVQTRFTPLSTNDMLAMANIGLINAQTEKVKEETKTEEGQNERGKAEVTKILEEAGAAKAAATNSAAEASFTAFQELFANMTMDTDLKMLQTKLQIAEQERIKAVFEAQREGLRLKFDKATYKDLVEQAKQKTLNLIMERREMLSKINLNQNQIYYLTNTIALGYKNLDLEKSRFNLDKLRFNFDKFKFNKEMSFGKEKFYKNMQHEHNITRFKTSVDFIGRVFSFGLGGLLMGKGAQNMIQPTIQPNYYNHTTIPYKYGQ